MTKMIVNARVGADGVLRLNLPVGAEDADQDVRITVEPAGSPKTMTQAEWAAWVQSMAGSITDPTFRRHPQGDYEQREALP